MFRFSCVFGLVALAIVLFACGHDAPMNTSQQLHTPKYLGHGDLETWLRTCCGLGDTISVDSGFELWYTGSAYDSLNGKHTENIGLRTRQWYPFSNQYLITHVETGPGKIKIRIDGVQSPLFLFEDFFDQSYVGESFQLDPGEYDVKIDYRDQSSRFVLSVTDTSMSVRSPWLSPKSSSVPLTILWDLYWRMKINECVLLCETELPESSWCQDYLDTITSEVKLTPVVYPSWGVRPFEAILPEPGLWDPWSYQYFMYDDTSDFARAGGLLKAYSLKLENRGISSYVYLVDYRQRAYYSWFDFAAQPTVQPPFPIDGAMDLEQRLHFRELAKTLGRRTTAR
jgi:hypothetical protein